MFTTLIAAALAAAAPAPAGQAPDPHAHAKHGMTGAMHGDMCKDCKSGEGAAKQAGCCCKGAAGADKGKCCAEHHGERKK